MLNSNINIIYWYVFTGMTPLIHAASNGHLEAVKTLIEYGANVNAMEDTYG